MPDNVTISYRGANYEIGRAHGYYGIWRVGEARTQPLEWWPETTEGWYSAWSRFTALEVPGTIGPVSETAAAEAPVPRRPVLAALVVALGVLLGVVGLFPDYLSGASLASQPAELVPHVAYLAGWCASALVMVSGGSRWRIGALLSAGISVVSFGFFFADAGTAIADGAHVMGSGLVLSLVGWLACAAGSTIAVSLAREDFKTLRPRLEMFPLIAMALCAIGVAAAFAPSWDSYVLQAATGSSETLTAGNVFANPAPIIAGNVAVMIAIVAVAVVAAVWRPVLHGIVLLAGAIIPMAAQAISALVQVGQGLPRPCSGSRRRPRRARGSRSPLVSRWLFGSTASSLYCWSSQESPCSAHLIPRPNKQAGPVGPRRWGLRTPPRADRLVHRVSPSRPASSSPGRPGRPEAAPRLHLDLPPYFECLLILTVTLIK